MYCRDVKKLVSIEILGQHFGVVQSLCFSCKNSSVWRSCHISCDPCYCLARGQGFFSLCLEYLVFSSHILRPQDLFLYDRKDTKSWEGCYIQQQHESERWESMGILFLVKDRVWRKKRNIIGCISEQSVINRCFGVIALYSMLYC